MNRVNLNPEGFEVTKITYPKRGHVVKLEPMKFIPHSGRARA